MTLVIKTSEFLVLERLVADTDRWSLTRLGLPFSYVHLANRVYVQCELWDASVPGLPSLLLVWPFHVRKPSQAVEHRTDNSPEPILQLKKEMDQLARRAESLEGSNSSLTVKLEAQREELTSRVQQAQFETAEVVSGP